MTMRIIKMEDNHNNKNAVFIILPAEPVNELFAELESDNVDSNLEEV